MKKLIAIAIAVGALAVPATEASAAVDSGRWVAAVFLVGAGATDRSYQVSIRAKEKIDRWTMRVNCIGQHNRVRRGKHGGHAQRFRIPTHGHRCWLSGDVYSSDGWIRLQVRSR